MKLPRMSARASGSLVGLIATASAVTAILTAAPAFAVLGGTSNTYNWDSGIPAGAGIGDYFNAWTIPAPHPGCVNGSPCATIEVWDYTSQGYQGNGGFQGTFVKTHYELQGGYLTPQIDANSTIDYKPGGHSEVYGGLYTSSYASPPSFNNNNDVQITNNMESGGGTSIKLVNGTIINLTSPGQTYDYDADNTQVSYITVR